MYAFFSTSYPLLLFSITSTSNISCTLDSFATHVLPEGDYGVDALIEEGLVFEWEFVDFGLYYVLVCLYCDSGW